MVHALHFFSKILLGVEVPFCLFLFLHAPHSLGRQFILPISASQLDIAKGVYKG